MKWHETLKWGTRVAISLVLWGLSILALAAVAHTGNAGAFLAAAAETPPEEDSFWDAWNPSTWAEAATRRAHQYLREQLVAYLNDAFRGTISIGKTEGSVIGSLTLHDVVLRYDDTDVVAIPRLTVGYDLRQLLRRRVQVTKLEAVQPVVRLAQDAAGHWNLLDAFTPVTAEDETPRPAQKEKGWFDIVLDPVIIQGARVAVVPAGQGMQPYTFTDTDLELRVDSVAAGVNAQVRHLTAQVAGPSLPPTQINGTLAYHGTTTPATVQITTLAANTSQSHLRLTGTISNLTTMQTQATLVLTKLAPVDIAHVLPDWPVQEQISGTVQLNGPFTDLHTQIALAAAGATITGTMQANLSQPQPRYQGTVTIAGFDTQQLLNTTDLAAVVAGTVHLSGDGASLAQVQATVDLQAQAVQIAAWQVGTVSVSGSYAHHRATLTGTLRGDIGRATWEGSLNVADTAPRYTVALAVDQLDIKKVTSGTQPVTTDLNLSGTVSGQGFSVATLEAQSSITVRPSTIGRVTLMGGRVDMRLADGRLHLDKFTLNATDANVAVHGELGVTTEPSGQLAYTLRVDDVSPWLSLVDQQGTGALALTGTATGSVTNLRAQGELTAHHLRVADTAIESGTVTFTLKEIGQPTPHGIITAKAQGINAGVPLQTAAATVTIPERQQAAAPLAAQVDVTARDAAARTQRLQGEMTYQPERITARLTTVQVETPAGTWRLMQPAQLVQERDRIVIDQLRLANGAQQLALAGQAGLSGPQDLRLQIEHVALATLLQPLLPQQPDLHGLLSVHAQVTGTATAPRVTSTLRLTDLQVAGQTYTGIEGTASYAQQQVSLILAVHQDPTHMATISGTLPVAVSWAEGWTLQQLGALDMRVHSSGLNLAFLNTFTDQAVNDVAGELGLDLTISGPLTKPQPQGTFTLTDGHATVAPLDVQVDRVTVTGRIDPEALHIDQLSARSGNGTLTGSGAVALRDYIPQQLSLSLTADRWLAIDTRSYHVELDGQLTAAGPPTQPHVTGMLRIPEATLRPDAPHGTASETRPNDCGAGCQPGWDTRVCHANATARLHSRGGPQYWGTGHLGCGYSPATEYLGQASASGCGTCGRSPRHETSGGQANRGGDHPRRARLGGFSGATLYADPRPGHLYRRHDD